MTTPSQQPTPETDAALLRYTGGELVTFPKGLGSGTVDVDFARRLECERDEARQEISSAVTRGKLEALSYSPEEKERYGKWVTEGEMYRDMRQERDQLRKVCDELYVAGQEWNHLIALILSGGATQTTMRAAWDNLVASQQNGHKSLDNYNSLPHVTAAQERNETK